MARITVSRHGTDLHIRADRDIEAPFIASVHSVGGGAGVPKHDRAAHASGQPHVCTAVRSGRAFRGWANDPAIDYRRVLADQYRNHDIDWRGFGE